MKKKLVSFLLLAIFCLPSIFPLFHPGFFQSDDGEWMIIRFSAFYQALADGQFPVRFLGRLNHEYGYPVANFLYPGFMYLGVPIHFFGFGFADTIKIILGLSMVGAVAFSYLWLSKFFDRLSSLAGSLFYLYTPYHLFDMYKRGSVGEVLALAVIPFILWQIERRSLFLSSIGIAALILSHNTLAVLFLGFIILYMGLDVYISKDKRGLLKKYLLMLMFGLGMSSFFWIPAFFELKDTVFSQTQISERNSYFSDVRLIGASTFLVLLLTLILFATSKIKISKHWLTLLLLIVGVVSVFFATSLSSPLWNVLPVSFIQFPFRLLSLTIVSVAFLSACVVSVLANKVKTSVAVLFLVILAISAQPFITPTDFFDKGEGFYATNMDTTTVKSEYMPKWVERQPEERFKEKVEIVEGVGIVKNVAYNSKKITFDVLAEENLKIRINTIYYPGWKARINNQNAEITYSNERGVMDINVRSGYHLVEARLTETQLRLASNIISIVSIFAVLVISAIGAKRRLLSL